MTNLTREELEARKKAHRCPSCDLDMSSASVQWFSDTRAYEIFQVVGLCESCQKILLKGEDEE